jgi:hypothetical protein
MVALTILNVTLHLHILPVLCINKIVIIVGVRAAQCKHLLHSVKEVAVAQWLRYCATNRKVAGSIPDGVIGIFH